MRVLLLFAILFVPTLADAGGSQTEIGQFRHRDGSAITFSVRRNQETGSLNGAGLACYDEHVIRSVHFFGLSRRDLETLRGLIDATLAELGK